jgi:hypothetical protein
MNPKIPAIAKIRNKDSLMAKVAPWKTEKSTSAQKYNPIKVKIIYWEISNG